MKKLILIILASSGLTEAQAQLFSPDALGGAFLGAMIGGVAGGNCHNGFSGNGAAIGAGVGLAAGALLGEMRRQDYYASRPYYYYPGPTVYTRPAAQPQPAPQAYWAAPTTASVHQIPDAPRVLDAPTF
jgi:hypothetical protein